MIRMKSAHRRKLRRCADSRIPLDRFLATDPFAQIREKDLIRRRFLYVFTDPLEAEMAGYRLVMEAMRVVFAARGAEVGDGG